MEVEKVFSMAGGNEDYSYKNTSRIQRLHFDVVKDHLDEAVKSMPLFENGCIRIADLGCSSSLNGILCASSIAKKLQYIYSTHERALPQILAIFSDLPSTDFNTLFALLKSQSELPYFIAAVPGSFHKRLFPSNTTHFVYSSFALHWLSKVPSAVVDSTSPAWNKGRVFIEGAPFEVVKAYQDQFRSDLLSFLKSRSAEMVVGGRLFLLLHGRKGDNPCDQSTPGAVFGNHFEKAWDLLVTEGVIEEDARDSFNMPIYAPGAQEFKGIVLEEGSFNPHKIEIVSAPRLEEEFNENFARFHSMSCRSVCGSLVEHHLGKGVALKFFENIETLVKTDPMTFQNGLNSMHHLIAILDRKPYS